MTPMTPEEQVQAEKRRHEYLLMEMRLIGEDIKDHIITKRIVPIEKFIYRALGALAVIAIVVPFLCKAGYFHTHTGNVTIAQQEIRRTR